MTIEKAVSRIGWRFNNCFFDKNGNKRDRSMPFVPDKEDLDCYNHIVDYVEQKQKNQINDNQLMGKLYVYLIDKFCDYYHCDLYDQTPQKEINKLLNSNLRHLVSELTDKLNQKELEHHIKENNTLEGLKKTTYDEVAENLKIMINGALNSYK
jgi:hypothetical protein